MGVSSGYRAMMATRLDRLMREPDQKSREDDLTRAFTAMRDRPLALSLREELVERGARPPNFLERKTRDALTEIGLASLYERVVFMFPPNAYGLVSHSPDYVTNGWVGDQRFVVEVKGLVVMERHYPKLLKRFSLFMKNFGNKGGYYYTTVMLTQRERLDQMLAVEGLARDDISHTILHLDLERINEMNKANPNESVRTLMARSISEQFEELKYRLRIRTKKPLPSYT